MRAYFLFCCLYYTEYRTRSATVSAHFYEILKKPGGQVSHDPPPGSLKTVSAHDFIELRGAKAPQPQLFIIHHSLFIIHYSFTKNRSRHFPSIYIRAAPPRCHTSSLFTITSYLAEASSSAEAAEEDASACAGVTVSPPGCSATAAPCWTRAVTAACTCASSERASWRRRCSSA